MTSIKIEENKILNGDNYHIWYDNITGIAKDLELSDYLTTDKIKICKEQNPNDKKELQKIIKNNNKLRLVIINSISNKKHEEIIGIEPVSVIIETLKTEYDKDVNDYTKWIKKIKIPKSQKRRRYPQGNPESFKNIQEHGGF